MGPGNRPLDLDWLEDFIVLAESGNFSRAAQARHIAQPAFSRHIKSLEAWVGVELFDRTTHPVALTAAGKHLLPEIEDVVQRLEAARSQALAAQEQAAVSLQFAATHALSLTFFPTWLGKIEAQLPVGRTMGPIQMVSDSFAACEDLMLQRRAQFLLCHGHSEVENRLDPTQFDFVAVGVDRLLPVSAPNADGTPKYAVAAQSSRKAGKSRAPVPVLAYGVASGIGQIMHAILGEALGKPRGVTTRNVFTAHHAVLLKTMAMEGRGVAWLPTSLIAAELASGALVRASDDTWTVPIEVRLFRPRVALSDAAEALWRVAAGTAN
ncbi:MAG: LysR family transcriptional regulator [Burkholderiales bacterium]|nr:LysR family transcriptional regulator [Burkholderiales bacterium]